MSAGLRLVAVAIILFLTHAAQAMVKCEACALVAQYGDAAIEQIENMEVNDLMLKDDAGKTPFYWSIFNSEHKIQNAIIERVGTARLVKDPSHEELLSACAKSKTCGAEELRGLLQMGFVPNPMTVLAPVMGSAECSIEKLGVLLEAGAPLSYRDKAAKNILHLLADKAQLAQSKNKKACFRQAMQLILQKAPQLRFEKNRAGRMPKSILR